MAVRYVIPRLAAEIDSIMRDNGFQGRGAKSLAQVKLVEYAHVGRKAEKMFENMTMGLYKDRRKKEELKF